MNIKPFTKKDKNIVAELDDEVEYIINDAAVEAIEKGAEKVTLIRVVDRAPQIISIKRIHWALHKEGVIDYLDKDKV